MFYIYESWLRNKDNLDKVESILDKYLYTDLISIDSDELNSAIKELTDIGEDIIIEKLEDGSIMIN